MKVTVDLSGLDSFIQEVEDEINQGLIDAAHKAVDTQKVRNESGKKTYENHTWNLRNAPGAAVDRNGEIALKTGLLQRTEWNTQALYQAKVLMLWTRLAMS